MTSNEENDGAREARSVACADAPGRDGMADAPKDGTKILAHHSLYGWMSIKWAQLLNDRDDLPWVTVAMDHAWPEVAFTHWMPLPPLPAARSESEDTQAKPTHTQEDVDALVKAATALRAAQRSYLGAKEHDPFITKRELDELGQAVGKKASALDTALTPFQKG